MMNQGTNQVHLVPKARALKAHSTASQVSRGQGATEVWTVSQELRDKTREPMARPALSLFSHPLGCGHSLGQKHRVLCLKGTSVIFRNTPLHIQLKQPLLMPGKPCLRGPSLDGESGPEEARRSQPEPKPKQHAGSHSLSQGPSPFPRP